jgi:hypothetical protein
MEPEREREESEAHRMGLLIPYRVRAQYTPGERHDKKNKGLNGMTFGAGNEPVWVRTSYK